MRLALDDTESGVTLLDGLPAVYRSPAHAPTRVVRVNGERREESFIEGMVDGFDQVLAPVHMVLRDLDAYFDPALCPVDFLEWLAGWLGVTLNARWPMQRRRTLLSRAVDIHKMRGTVWGIAKAVELYTGVEPEITESGACVASGDPAADLPGSPRASLQVTVRSKRSDIDHDVVERIVADAKPAHVTHEVRIITED